MLKRVILFPGQGSLKIDMAKQMYLQNKIVKNVFEEVSECLHLDLYSKLDNNDYNDIFTISYAIFTLSVSTYRTLRQQVDMENAIFAGHSLGEISALTCSGVFSVEDAVKLIKGRAMIASEAKYGGMNIVSNIKSDTVHTICSSLRRNGEQIWVSCDNTDLQTCIAGEENSLAKASSILQNLGGNIRYMKTNLPYHCNILDYGTDRLADLIRSLKIEPMEHIVMSNVFAKPYKSKDDVVNNLCLQFTEMVRWRDTVRYLDSQRFDECYEMAFSDVLTKMIYKLTKGWKVIHYKYDKS